MLWGYINKYSQFSRRGVAKTSSSTLLVSLRCRVTLSSVSKRLKRGRRVSLGEKKRKVERKLPPRLATGDVFSASLARQSV